MIQDDLAIIAIAIFKLATKITLRNFFYGILAYFIGKLDCKDILRKHFTYFIFYTGAQFCFSNR